MVKMELNSKRMGINKMENVNMFTALKKYATFSGRARRKEYWMFSLFYFITYFAVLIISSIIFPGNVVRTSTSVNWAASSAASTISMLVMLGLIVPSIAVTVRRLHDLGKSGGWCFIGFIPFIGGIWLLVLMCSDGNQGPNMYGPDPKNPYAAPVYYPAQPGVPPQMPGVPQQQMPQQPYYPPQIPQQQMPQQPYYPPQVPQQQMPQQPYYPPQVPPQQ